MNRDVKVSFRAPKAKAPFWKLAAMLREELPEQALITFIVFHPLAMYLVLHPIFSLFK